MEDSADETHTQRERETAVRAVRIVGTVGAWSKKRWQGFNLDLNRTLLARVPLQLLRQQVAVLPFAPLLVCIFFLLSFLLLFPAWAYILPLHVFNFKAKGKLCRELV